jgi:hypothetical protein
MSSTKQAGIDEALMKLLVGKVLPLSLEGMHEKKKNRMVLKWGGAVQFVFQIKIPFCEKKLHLEKLYTREKRILFVSAVGSG